MDVRLIMELQCERFVYLCPHSHMFPEVELLCSGCSGKEYPPPPVMCIFPTDVCTRASSCLFMRRRATLDKFTAICPEWMAAINEAGSTSFGQITLQAVMALPIALLHSSEPCNHHNSSIGEASIQCSSSQIDSLACSSPIHPSLSVTGPT